jgi:thiamine-phosphate pyrophosphorylase
MTMTTDIPPHTDVSESLRASRQARLARASLYLCTDARSAQGDLAEFLDAAYAGGVDIIQLRDKTLEARAEIAALEVLKDAAGRHGKLFSVNDRADVALLTGADVFHVGQGDLTSAQARAVLGDDVILGRSTHSRDQALAAEADGEIDYFCVGPVWQTPTKPGRRAVGTQLLSEVGRRGGPNPGSPSAGSRPAPASTRSGKRGARRAVVVRAITSADDPPRPARDLKEELG